MFVTTSGNNRPTLKIIVQPKARKTGIIGLHDGMLKLAVASPPVDGKANREVVAFLADLFELKKKEVIILRGEHSRKKTCLLGDLDADEIRKKITPYL